MALAAAARAEAAMWLCCGWAERVAWLCAAGAETAALLCPTGAETPALRSAASARAPALLSAACAEAIARAATLRLAARLPALNVLPRGCAVAGAAQRVVAIQVLRARPN